jgi:putative sugar O-methyltransferase
MSERTSISDEDEYTSFCEQASTRDEVFQTFKRDPRYRKVLEHVTPAEGMAYLSLIGQHYPFLGGYIDAFRANDSVGAPVTHDFGAPLGSWSPTTFRYAKVAGDLLTMFGDLEGADIAEIGAGYGGQCLLLSKLLRWRSYTIFDLAPVQKLQRRYLSGFDVPGVAFESVDKLPRGKSYDLVISNYAFSECARGAGSIPRQGRERIKPRLPHLQQYRRFRLQRARVARAHSARHPPQRDSAHASRQLSFGLEREPIRPQGKL